MPLMNLHDVVTVIGGVFMLEDERAMPLVDLDQAQIVLDDAYCTASPETEPVTAAAGRLLTTAAERLPRTGRWDRAVLALTHAFAEHHGASIHLRPLHDGLGLVRAARTGLVAAPDAQRWLARRCSQDAVLLPRARRPLLGLTTTVAHGVTHVQDMPRRKSADLVRELDRQLVRLGGRLMCPTPRQGGAGAPAGEDVDDAEVRRRVCNRLREPVVVVFPDEGGSTGGPIEAASARDLGAEVLLLTNRSRTTPWLNRSRVHLLPYPNAAAAAGRVADWQVANRWTLLNADRHRRDRALMRARRFVALRAAWSAQDRDRQEQIAGWLRTTRNEIDDAMGSVQHLRLLLADDIDRLQAALQVTLPLQRPPAREFDDGEIDALSQAAEQWRIPVGVAMSAAMDLLVELSEPGVKRARMTVELWVDYFRTYGLIEP